MFFASSCCFTATSNRCKYYFIDTCIISVSAFWFSVCIIWSSIVLAACLCCLIVWLVCKFFQFCNSALLVLCVMLKWIFPLDCWLFLFQYYFYVKTCSLGHLYNSLMKSFCITQSYLFLSMQLLFVFPVILTSW